MTRQIIDIDDVRDTFSYVRENLHMLTDLTDEKEALRYCRDWWQEELDRVE